RLARRQLRQQRQKWLHVGAIQPLLNLLADADVGLDVLNGFAPVGDEIGSDGERVRLQVTPKCRLKFGAILAHTARITFALAEDRIDGHRRKIDQIVNVLVKWAVIIAGKHQLGAVVDDYKARKMCRLALGKAQVRIAPDVVADLKQEAAQRGHFARSNLD